MANPPLYRAASLSWRLWHSGDRGFEGGCQPLTAVAELRRYAAGARGRDRDRKPDDDDQAATIYLVGKLDKHRSTSPASKQKADGAIDIARAIDQLRRKADRVELYPYVIRPQLDIQIPLARHQALQLQHALARHDYLLIIDLAVHLRLA